LLPGAAQPVEAMHRQERAIAWAVAEWRRRNPGENRQADFLRDILPLTAEYRDANC